MKSYSYGTSEWITINILTFASQNYSLLNQGKKYYRGKNTQGLPFVTVFVSLEINRMA